MYIIDFTLLAKRLTPPDKRLEAFLAWLKSLLAPMGTVNTKFFGVYFPDVVSRAKRTGQKIILENTLNIEFNPGGSPKIYIDNTGDDLQVQFLYNENEGYPPIYLYNKYEAVPYYLNNETEFNSEFDFLVYVPNQVFNNFNADQIGAEVDKYRPAGKTFAIIPY